MAFLLSHVVQHSVGGDAQQPGFERTAAKLGDFVESLTIALDRFLQKILFVHTGV
jgi:hypothetical protein